MSPHFDHVGLRVRDFPRAVSFFKTLLEPLGLTLQHQGEDYAGFGDAEHTPLWLHASPKTPPGGVHLAFRAATREAVQRFHAAGLAAGARDHGAPGPRPDYGPTYYAAFLIDADNNNLEAVCMAR